MIYINIEIGQKSINLLLVIFMWANNYKTETFQQEKITPWGEQQEHLIRFKPFRVTTQVSNRAIFKKRNLSKPIKEQQKVVPLISTIRNSSLESRMLAKTLTLTFQLNKIQNKSTLQRKLMHKSSINLQTINEPKPQKFRIHNQFSKKQRNTTSSIDEKSFFHVKMFKSPNKKKLVINSQNNFFHSLSSRGKTAKTHSLLKHTDRVGEMLQIIRQTMKKDQKIGKMVRKTERDYLKFDWKCRRQGIF